jgi:glucose-6-phosphate isomerase
MTKLNSSLPAWIAVANHAQTMQSVHLRELAAADPTRWEHFHVGYDGWLLDLSRQRITHETLALLLDLARATDLSGHIAAMFRGDFINSTEQRAALHTALRSDFAGNAAIQAEVHASRRQLSAFAGAVRSGEKRGITGKKFKHVSNVDRTQLEDLTRVLDPAETLVIVCSKTFITMETQSNANAARAWIVGALGEQSPGNHFVAVSTNASAMDAFGIAKEHRFTMWDWVGGRYSVWSAIGLVAEIVVGSERFQEFLNGASDIDRHFTTAPFEQNLPVLMGVVGAWNRTFLGLPTLAVLPYDQRLARLPAYLQQLEMESNGKTVSLAGERVNFATAPVVWGEPASNAQHSFFQMLHQGTPTAALDFIAPLRGSWGGTEGQDLALKNCLAQSQAFAYGYTLAETEAEMTKAGSSQAEIERLGPHKVYEGNRPSSLLLFPETTARTLGALIALYEHSVFVQGTLWGINSFDQFGVELGKKLAVGIDMTGKVAPTGHGAAGLKALIDYVKGHR